MGNAALVGVVLAVLTWSGWRLQPPTIGKFAESTLVAARLGFAARLAIVRARGTRRAVEWHSLRVPFAALYVLVFARLRFAARPSMIGSAPTNIAAAVGNAALRVVGRPGERGATRGLYGATCRRPLQLVDRVEGLAAGGAVAAITPDEYKTDKQTTASQS